jgi:hypothetical protein
MSHTALPQRTQLPQSPGQLLQSSPRPHMPSPQRMQLPQSPGQLVQFSVAWQM